MSVLRWAALPALLLWVLALTAGELRIVVTSDLHGDLRSYAALAAAIRAHTAGRPALLVDLGDTVPGTFVSEYAENSTGMAEALACVGVELWVPGNHDFELAPDAFRDFVRRFRGTALGGDWQYAGVSGAPFAIVERGGVRCAVIGLTDPKMPHRVLPGFPAAFRDPFAVLDEVMPRIFQAGPQVVVLAWHNGLHSKFGDLRELLRRHPGIDVVLGGHTHQEVPGRRIGRRTLYVQPGAHGCAAGVVDICTDDATGRLTRVTSMLVRGDPAAPDAALVALERRLDAECRGVRLGKLGDWTPPRSGDRGSALGRRAAEGLRAAGNSDAALLWLDVDDGWRRGQPFTCGDLYRIMPHRNVPCVLAVSRAELAAFIAETDREMRRRGRLLFAAGIGIGRSGAGAVTGVECPERLTLTVADWLVADSRILRPLAGVPERKFRRLDRLERDIVADALAGKPASVEDRTKHPQP